MNQEDPEKVRADPERFAILKNIKAHRDGLQSISASDESAFGDSGYTSGHFSSYSHEHVSGRNPSLLLEPIEEEHQSTFDFLATPSHTQSSTSPQITPTTANMHKIMNLHITTPTEIKQTVQQQQFVEPKTPQKALSSSLIVQSVTPRKAKVSRKRSLTEDENGENSANVKRSRASVEQKDTEEVLAKRIPFSPHNQRNQRLKRFLSDNQLLKRSSTPKTTTRRHLFTGEVEKTPEKRGTLRRFTSLSPRVAEKRKAEGTLRPLKRSMAFDEAGTSVEFPNKVLKNIPEDEHEADEVRDATMCTNLSLSFSAYEDASFKVSPIKVLGFDKLFDAPLVSGTPQSFRKSDSTKTDSYSLLNKSVELSPTKLSNLLFNDLPRTPPKKTPQKKSKSRTTPTPKKNLFINRELYFDSLETMDIVGRLQGMPTLVEHIFQYVDDKDLFAATMVSKRWRATIEDSHALNVRKLEYNKREKYKENMAENLIPQTEFRRRYPRKAFATYNYETRSSKKVLMDQSPPASPATAKFRENQKVIRKLSPHAMTKCILCGKPSPVITQTAADVTIKIGCQTRSSAKKSPVEVRRTVSDLTGSSSSSSRKNPFTLTPLFDFKDSSGSESSSSGSDKNIRRALFEKKTKSCPSIETSPIVSSDHSLASPKTNNKKNGSLLQTPRATAPHPEFEEYAKCSGKNCGFVFCLKCHMKYHPGEPCRIQEIQSPGTIEELTTSRGNLMCSRQSRRTLKRLCA